MMRRHAWIGIVVALGVLLVAVALFVPGPGGNQQHAVHQGETGMVPLENVKAP